MALFKKKAATNTNAEVDTFKSSIVTPSNFSVYSRTALSLLFFTLSIFATSYSIRNSFEKEVVSVSQMIENQLDKEEVINNNIIPSNKSLNNSIYNFDAKVDNFDTILTLSTCYGDNRKLVLHAKLIKKEIKNS